VSGCSWSGRRAPGAILISAVTEPVALSKNRVLVEIPGKRLSSQGSPPTSTNRDAVDPRFP
jgi:hypothetical protein